MEDALFTFLLFASCAYACAAGGKEGRCVSLLLISAALLSIPASFMDPSWSQPQIAVLAVDLLLLAGLAAVATLSRRYWPLWVTGFHLVSVSTHVARLAEPSLKPLVYFAVQSFWSLPGLLVMVAGIMLDRRAGLPRDEDWKRGISS
jgi:hypothetical protein